MKSQEKSPLGCLILFGLPFAVFGLLGLLRALKEATGPSPRLEAVYIPGLAGIVFLGVGAVLMVAGTVGYRTLKKQRQLKEQYPDEPWMWREHWISGKIKSSSSTKLVFLWIFAILWNAVSIPMLFFFIFGSPEKENMAWLLILIFPFIGVLLLMGAMVETLRWKKYGISLFEMTAFPGVIGGKMEGAIYTDLKDSPTEGVHLTLSCVNRVTSGSGESRSTHEHILFQEKYKVGRESLSRGFKGVIIPVSFDIPIDARASDSSRSDNTIMWKLKVHAPMPGVDYNTEFEVPVFRTAESERLLKEEAKKKTYKPVAVTEYAPSPYMKIKIQASPRGGTLFYFPPARNVNAAIGLTIFFLIWSAGVVAMFVFGLPAFFAVAFALFDFLIFIGVLQLWFSASTLIIEGGVVKIRKSMFGIGGTREIPCQEVKDVTVTRGMQSGTTLYNDIIVRLTNGSKVKIIRTIKNRRDAEGLKEKIKYEIEKVR